MAPQLSAASVRDIQRGLSLAEFLHTQRLSPAEQLLDGGTRLSLLDMFTQLLEGLYVHLPLKRTMYGKDPVQRLRLLRQRAEGLLDSDFHAELSAILTELRDAHTRYVGPSEWRMQVAILPFMLESFGDPGSPQFLVSNVVKTDPVIQGTNFEKGVEILSWSGVPIARAVERYADRETGGRPDARRARAVESLTFRALGYGQPPDEYWVQIEYQSRKGKREELRIDWRVIDLRDERESDAAQQAGQLAYAVDRAAEAVRRAKNLLFAPKVWLADRLGTAEAVKKRAPTPINEWITGQFPSNVAAKEVETPSGRFGYLRLWSFDLVDDDGFLADVAELLGKLPTQGLIIDLRGNPGGLIWAAERLLQLFTPNEVTPSRFSLVATDLTRTMAAAPQNALQFGPWLSSLKSAVANGESYSRSLPLTPPTLCCDIGQLYGGPVVGVVDANTYSAGDLFAAGFVDNGVGPLVSIGQATGAGGANVWGPNDVRRALAGTSYDLGQLPEGLSFTVAARRAVRTGSAAGTIIEDVGVAGHFRYDMTRDDLTRSNVDLIAYCGALLASEPRSSLRLERTGPRKLRMTTEGLDRLDLFADGHPVRSIRVGAEPVDMTLPAPWSEANVLGFMGDTLRQRRIVRR